MESWRILRAPTKTRSRDDRKQLVKQWAGLLDEAFFYGSLMNKIAEIQFSGVEEGRYGHYEHSGSGLCINLEEKGPSDYEGTLEQHLICTLVHVMLLAFLEVYGCVCAECRQLAHPSDGAGKSGHGPAWADSLKIIEDSLQEAVDWPVYTGIWKGVQRSMVADKWQATQSQIDRWTFRSPFHSEISQPDGGPSDGSSSEVDRTEDGVSDTFTARRRRRRSPSHRKVHQIAGHKVPQLAKSGEEGGCAIM
jgi:hypothetical protein